MGVVKQFSSSPSFKAAVKKSLKQHSAADLLFNFGEVMYDQYQNAVTRKEKSFYLKAGMRLIKAVEGIKKLERAYVR
jgi:hypothetical protein